MTTSQTTKGKQNKTSIVVKSKKQLMQILDTTLLKCYLKINDSLVASLLRLKNNFCHQEETERALKKCQKYPELIIFYNTKGAHKKGTYVVLKPTLEYLINAQDLITAQQGQVFFQNAQGKLLLIIST